MRLYSSTSNEVNCSQHPVVLARMKQFYVGNVDIVTDMIYQSLNDPVT